VFIYGGEKLNAFPDFYFKKIAPIIFCSPSSMRGTIV